MSHPEGENGDEEEEEEEDEGEDGSMGDEEYVEDEVDEEEEGPNTRMMAKNLLSMIHLSPYSYRKGYTWAGTTANELMAIWQGLPYVKHNNGQITLTQPSQRTLSREPHRYTSGLLVSMFHMSRGRRPATLFSAEKGSLRLRTQQIG